MPTKTVELSQADKLTLLKEWESQVKGVNATFDAMAAVTGLTPESKLATQLYSTLEVYTQTLGRLLGDQSNWLAWYMWDNNCGERGLEVTSPKWKKPLKVKTVRNLLRVLTL